jgi:hypothetical protein
VLTFIFIQGIVSLSASPCPQRWQLQNRYQSIGVRLSLLAYWLLFFVRGDLFFDYSLILLFESSFRGGQAFFISLLANNERQACILHFSPVGSGYIATKAQ